MSLRIKAIVLTIGFLLLYASFQFFIDISGLLPLNQEISKALIVSVVFFFGLYWVFNFNIRSERYITILGYSSFMVFIQSLFLELVVFQNIGRISEKTISIIILAIFGLSIYFLILTANILNVSYVSKIPLAQAAKASNFIYTLSGAYIAFLLILQAGVSVPIQFSLYLGTIAFLTFNIFWFKKESLRQLMGESFAVIVFMLSVFIILMLWPLSTELSVMFYTVTFYILLGLGLEDRDTTSMLMRIEYVVIFIIAVFLLLRFTIWGINGSII